MIVDIKEPTNRFFNTRIPVIESFVVLWRDERVDFFQKYHYRHYVKREMCVCLNVIERVETYKEYLEHLEKGGVTLTNGKHYNIVVYI